jgi:TRAP-type C4-dicarboxylate transport system permease large subunit
MGIAYSLVAGLLIYRGGLNWRVVPQMLVQTASLSGAILFLIGNVCCNHAMRAQR